MRTGLSLFARPSPPSPGLHIGCKLISHDPIRLPYGDPRTWPAVNVTVHREGVTIISICSARVIVLDLLIAGPHLADPPTTSAFCLSISVFPKPSDDNDCINDNTPQRRCCYNGGLLESLVDSKCSLWQKAFCFFFGMLKFMKCCA